MSRARISPRRRSPLLALLLAPALLAGAGSAFAQPQPCDFTVDFCGDTFRKDLLLIQYTAGACSVSAHDQSAGSVVCNESGTLPDLVRLVVADRDLSDPQAKRWFDGTVRRGEVIEARADRAGETRLGAAAWAFLYDGPTLLQTVRFVTSCEEPLVEGDRFGALRLSRPRFPSIPVWADPRGFDDGSRARPRTCVGALTPPADSLVSRARTVSVRFLRDRRAEASRSFGGYRVYRVTVTPDTSRMVLLRRFSRQAGDERTWNFSTVDTTQPASLNFRCGGQVVHDSIVTFVDPDSNGNFVKVACRDERGGLRPGCRQLGDSIFVLVPPPGPHNGFRTWYAVTYEERNQSLDALYQDHFVPDTFGIIGPCRVPGDPLSCHNLNNKCYNMTEAVEPTPGPTANLERVGVVPNPFRAREAWDRPDANEVHFVNLPEQATILIYTASGDQVRRIEHADRLRDFERWDLKNQEGRDVASGIYMFRIESTVPRAFSYQDRFVVIR